MKGTIIIYLALVCLLFACNKEAVLTQEEESIKVEKLAARVMGMTEGVACNNSSDWAYTSFGSKPCGGPSGYIAYPNSINRVEFLALVEQYRQATEVYNQNWGLISDCAIMIAPKDIVCEDGKPVLVY
jgi:hypothetical protein